MVDSVTRAGVQAVQRGQQTATTASNRVARAGTTATTEPTRDITRGAVELMESEQLVKAGAKVIKTADRMLGSLLDEKA